MTREEFVKEVQTAIDAGTLNIPMDEEVIGAKFDEILAQRPDIYRIPKELMHLGDLPDQQETPESKTPFRDWMKHIAMDSKGALNPEISKTLIKGNLDRGPARMINMGVIGDNKIPEEIIAKDMAIGTDSLGGYIVPTEESNSLIDLTNEQSVVPGMCQQVRPSTNAIVLPTLSGSFTAYWTAEGDVTGTSGAFTESTGTFGNVTLTLYKVGILAYVSVELLEDSDPSMEPILVNNITGTLGAAWDYGCLFGNSTAGTAASNSLIAGLNGQISTYDTAAGATFDFKDFLDLKKPRANTQGALDLVMHPDAEIAALKITDGNGNHMYAPPASGDGLTRIWGMPVRLDNNIPTTQGGGSETTIFSGAFGTDAFAGIKNAISFVAEVGQYAEYGVVKYVGMFRVGFAISNENRFGRLTAVNLA